MLLPYFSLSHNDDGYYHDTKDLPPNPDWMKGLPDAIKLRDISIPGTHDSIAYKKYLIDYAKCQSLTLSQQLMAGIRYVDIRPKYENGRFRIVHGPLPLDLYLDQVLAIIANFLKLYPSETVLMRIMIDQGISKDLFVKVFDQNLNVQAKYMWKSLPFANPTLKEIRGKIVIIQESDANDAKGIPQIGIFESSFCMQNYWHLGSNWKLHDKWLAVKKLFMESRKGKGCGFLNWLSGSFILGKELPVFPYFVASGHSDPRTDASRLATGLTTPGFKNYYPDFPRVACFIGICSIVFEGTNTLAKNYINNNKLNYVGIVPADFPGAGLIKAIIAANFR